MVEDIIYNLCNNIDILETNKKIIAYKGTSSNIFLKLVRFFIWSGLSEGSLFRFEYDTHPPPPPARKKSRCFSLPSDQRWYLFHIQLHAFCPFTFHFLFIFPLPSFFFQSFLFPFIIFFLPKEIGWYPFFPTGGGGDCTIKISCSLNIIWWCDQSKIR
jgi:hypothetical protein